MTTTAELVKRLLDAGATSDVVALFLEAVAEVQKAETEKVGRIAATLEQSSAKEVQAQVRRLERVHKAAVGRVAN
jgi:hypothetical protein